MAADVVTHRRWAGRRSDLTMNDWLASITAWDHFLEANSYSARTRGMYKYYLIRFTAEILKTPLDVTEDDVTSWLATIGGNGSARMLALRGLKSYYGWALERRLVAADPTGQLKTKQIRNAEAKVLSDEEIIQLFTAADTRDRRRGLAMRLCYYTGARVESLASIKPEDIDFDQHVIHLTNTKGNRPYTVPMGQACERVARELLELFDPTRRWNLIGVRDRTFWMWVNQAAQDAGIKASPHTLRHSFATHLLNRGANVKQVKELLNHASVETTMRYVHVTDEQKHAAVALLD